MRSQKPVPKDRIVWAHHTPERAMLPLCTALQARIPFCSGFDGGSLWQGKIFMDAFVPQYCPTNRVCRNFTHSSSPKYVFNYSSIIIDLSYQTRRVNPSELKIRQTHIPGNQVARSGRQGLRRHTSPFRSPASQYQRVAQVPYRPFGTHECKAWEHN